MTHPADPALEDTVDSYPATAAQLALTDRREGLEDQIESGRTILAARADAFTKAQLLDKLAALGATVAKSADKAALARAWVAAMILKETAHKELRALEYAARLDTMADDRVQALIDAADETVARFLKGVDGDNPLAVLAHRIQWDAEDVLAAHAARRYALNYRGARMTGQEPKVVARTLAGDAMRRLISVATNPSNLRPTGHGMGEVAEATGARTFLRAVAVVVEDIPTGLY